MTKIKAINAQDLKGVLAYLITPVVEGADRNTKQAINLDEASRAVERMIGDGVSGFCLNGTFGEAPSVTAAEQKALTACVVETTRGRVPVFGGATSLNTRESLERARAARDVGADGLMLGRPMMATMSDANIIRYYRDVAEELPELAIILYDDQEAFKRPITTEVYRELSKIPQIVACKYRTRILVSGMLENVYNRDLEAVEGRIKLMPSEIDWEFCNYNFGTDTIWSSSVNGGPAPTVALGAALKAGDRERAKAISREMSWSVDGLFPPGGLEVWHADKIPFMKARFKAAGYLDPGPPLPPYTYLSEARLAIARELGERAKMLQDKYQAEVSVAA